ncbi:MAG TPA: iron-sulfur cluster repair di-iron protein [Bryobacteraceae bacterium]|nr:iron-sulfur cluster repair di-iron protein [Bryobacteraceae bacterium]
MTTLQPETTVAEIAANSLAAIGVFERLGIDYCCGGKRPLADVCQAKGYRLAEVERELESASAIADAPATDWNTAPIPALIDHIVETHHVYLKREMPLLSARAEKVHRVYADRRPGELDGLPEVFDQLRAELDMHLMKEEMILFPAIKAKVKELDSGIAAPPTCFGTLASPIAAMEYEHEEAGAALARIREITNDFAIPDYACATYRALILGLEEFERDLHRHIHLENNILHPRALSLIKTPEHRNA